jgi:hypothetical protein
MRESDIEDYLCDRVKEAGGEVRKVKWIGRNGAPDRLVMFPSGWLCFVELKAPGVAPEAHQSREHARLEKMNQMVAVIDSKELVDMLVNAGGGS